VQLKCNQKSLRKAVEEIAKTSQAIDVYRSEERKRGRNEIREVEIYEPVKNMPEGWESINTIIRVVRERTIKGEIQKEESYYISSLSSKKAKEFANGIRGHWSIENRLHWVKDVMQNEDKSGIKKNNGVEVLSIFKTISINITRELGYDSIKYFQDYYICNVHKLVNFFRR